MLYKLYRNTFIKTDQINTMYILGLTGLQGSEIKTFAEQLLD